MKRITTGIIVSLAAFSLATSACSKKDDKAAGGEAGKAADKGAAAGGAKAAATAATGFGVFPADSELVMSFSLAGLRSSAMWAQIAPLVQAQIDKEMAEIKTECGLDPVAKLESIIVGGKPSDEKNMVVVVKGFTKEEITNCGTAMAKKEGKQFSVTEEDGLTKINSEGEDAYMAWLDPTTAVVSPNPDKAWIKDRAAGKNGLDGNAAFMELLKNVDSNATVWFAALPAPGGEMDMSQSLQGAKGAFGSLKIADGLAVDAGVRFDTADNAKNAQTMATGALQQGKAMMPPQVQTVIDKAKLSVAASDLILQLQLTNDDLNALGAALGPMMGGMMGGAAGAQ